MCWAAVARGVETRCGDCSCGKCGKCGHQEARLQHAPFSLAAVRRAAEQANRADLRSSRAVSTAVGGVLRALQATEQLLVLLQRHYHDVVLPHLAHAINWHTKVSERRMRVLAVLILAHR